MIMDRINLPGIVAYLDDILMHTKSLEEHVTLLEEVLKGHRQAGVKLNPKKTELFRILSWPKPIRIRPRIRSTERTDR